MNQTEPQELKAQEIPLADLPAENDEDIKGGPSTQSKRTVILKSTVAADVEED